MPCRKGFGRASSEKDRFCHSGSARRTGANSNIVKPGALAQVECGRKHSGSTLLGLQIADMSRIGSREDPADSVRHMIRGDCSANRTL